MNPTLVFRVAKLAHQIDGSLVSGINAMGFKVAFHSDESTWRSIHSLRGPSHSSGVVVGHHRDGGVPFRKNAILARLWKIHSQNSRGLDRPFLGLSLQKIPIPESLWAIPNRPTKKTSTMTKQTTIENVPRIDLGKRHFGKLLWAVWIKLLAHSFVLVVFVVFVWMFRRCLVVFAWMFRRFMVEWLEKPTSKDFETVGGNDLVFSQNQLTNKTSRGCVSAFGKLVSKTKRPSWQV
jgi:hypothetical protein